MITKGLKTSKRVARTGTKLCIGCQKELSVSDFSICKRKNPWHPGLLEYYKSYYKPCEVWRVKVAKWARRYGLTPQQFNEMCIAQSFKCYLCGIELKKNAGKKRNEQFCVDHNHLTGKVRSLLCWMCNAGLGMFKDNPEVLAKAALYVQGRF